MTEFVLEQLDTVKAICTPGKGILAADESTGTIGKRFTNIGLENNEENRRRYRHLLFSTEGLEKHISGVITFEETLETKLEDGRQLTDLLREKGIVVGIKTDKGVKHLTGTRGETVTQGLDDLDKRCQYYYKLGARFAKWRDVLKIDARCPSELSINQNAEVLARYASISQENGLVPIVEPEILMDGAHTIEDAARVTENVLSATYRKLMEHHVNLETTLLKPNMVRQGVEPHEINIRREILGIIRLGLCRGVFQLRFRGLSFYQEGCQRLMRPMHLTEVNLQEGHKLLYLSFSYGRAMQHSVLKVWKGEDTNVAAAQKMLLFRATANGQATLGKYDCTQETSGDESLHVKDYKY